MPFKPVRSSRLSDKIVLDVIEKIQQGELVPGDKLPPENQLAELYGISRGILREAFTILQTRGYIRRKPKDGTYISEALENERLNGSVMSVLKKASYIELLEMRECLEIKAIEMAINRASDDDIYELIEKLQLGQGSDTHSNIDQYFHFSIAELSGNSLFMSFIDMYYDLISEIALQSKKNISRRDAINTEHLAIANAMRQRDVKKAQKATAHHMGQIRAALENIDSV